MSSAGTACCRPSFAERLARAVGFRNVLVHDYVDVDDKVVLARLDDPSDLADFTAAVSGWIRPQG